MERTLRWIAESILPFEPDVRRWLRRSFFGRHDEDDLIQEAYCRIARVEHPETVRNGRAYFFSVVKNLLVERLRRERLVRIEAMAEIESLFIIDDKPGPERSLIDRQTLSQVMEIMETLPERARTVLTLRRINGLSQRETAERLNLTENVVEKQTAAALRLLMEKLAESAEEHGYLPGKRRRASGNRG